MAKNNFLLEIFILILILAISFFLMFRAALGESAIMDELAHIPAGYSYLKFLDYRLNPEHPPLVKALSALPLLKLNLHFPSNHKSWIDDVNGQWDVGSQFLYKYGNDADLIIKFARLFPIFLTLFTAILIYTWSRELLGNFWAVLPTLFFALSPTVLAHGHYVTTDIGATFGVIIASYFFIRYLFRPSKKRILLAGFSLGLAELTKFSLALLIPYFLILAAFYSFGLAYRNKENFWKILFKIVGGTVLIFILALVVIYAAYFLFTINYLSEKQFKDAEHILASFSPHWLADVDLKMTKISFLRPLAQYFLGFLMVLQRSAGGNTGYFLGEVSAAGSPLYFPLVYLLKEPLPLLVFIFLSLFLVFKNIFLKAAIQNTKLNRFANYLGTHFPEFAMILFVFLYWSYSIRSPLNIGLRHLLPTIPFIYILSTSGIKTWFENNKTLAKKLFILAAVAWFLAEVFFAAPNFLSYFNEIAGGTQNGYRYVTDSNYDWGQDLKKLKAWAEKNLSRGEKIAVDYFGGGDPKYYLDDTAEYWWSAKGNPKEAGIGWLAVSINTLEGAFGKLHPGQPRKAEDEYRWLRDWRPPQKGLGQVSPPDFRVGTSIFVYKL